jgi:hypothetical protein
VSFSANDLSAATPDESRGVEIPLGRRVVIPGDLEELSSAALVGDRSVVEQVMFTPGSHVRVLGASALCQLGSHSAAIRKGIHDMRDGPEDDAEQFAECAHRLRRLMHGPARSPLCIPASVEEIGLKCFAWNACLSSVTFEPGSRLRILQRRAFAGSTIRSIEIPAMVTFLPESSFEYCGVLSSVTFAAGSQLRTIGGCAFFHCDFESILIPRSVEAISQESFARCTRLSNVMYEAGSELSTIGDMAFCNCPMLGPSIELPRGVEVLQRGSFFGCEVSVLTFAPDSALREIQMDALAGFSLKSICIPASCVKIDWRCFSEHARETVEVTFETPAKLREISRLNGETVSQLAIPDSVEIITVTRGGNRGFVCSFGRDSQLRDLKIIGNYMHRLRGSGFMRLSEASLKRLRPVNEGMGPGLLPSKPRNQPPPSF